MLNWEIQNNRISFSDEKQNPMSLNFNEIYNLVYPKDTSEIKTDIKDFEKLSKIVHPGCKFEPLKVSFKLNPSDYPMFSLDYFDETDDQKKILGSLAEYLERDHAVTDKLKVFSLPQKNFVRDLFESEGIDPNEPFGLSEYLKLKSSELAEQIDFSDFSADNEEMLNAIDQSSESTTFFTNDPNIKLRDYQTTGFRWMKNFVNAGVGVVLADEMGLGKTLQVIRLVCDRLAKGEQPSLIVGPLSLIENWKREFMKFTDGIDLYIHHGPYRELETEKFRNKNSHVVLTSYETLRSDVNFLKQFDWDLVILDEAHSIKNPSSQRSLSARDINKTAGIAITGTPFEHRLTDLWTIYDFVQPGHLGSLEEFNENYDNSILGGEALADKTASLMLRRKTKDVAKDLPELVINPIPIEMSQTAKMIYERTRTGIHGAIGDDRLPNFADLVPLRQICSHPELDAFKKGEPLNPIANSHKYERLVEILTQSENQKSIIFTQWIPMINLMTQDLGKRFKNHFIGSITGDVDQKDRQKIIDKFSDYDGGGILILNYQVGATGLNIQAADNVILYSPDWGPATEDQAIKRAHRIGRKDPVKVYKLFYAHTLEEVMYEMIEKKRAIGDAAVLENSGEDSSSALIEYLGGKQLLSVTPMED